MDAVQPPYPARQSWPASCSQLQELEHLLQTLELDDPGTASSDQAPLYLYRGQLARRPARVWPPEPAEGLALPQNYYWLENLLPSDYRNLEAYASQHGRSALDHALLVRLETLRAALTVHCCTAVAQQRADKGVLDWLSQHQGQWDHIGALGQHSGLPTQYLDWSSSKHVALWMATHNFMTNEYRPGEHSVLYRLHVPTLDAVIADVNGELGLNGQMAVRRLDLRGIPPLLARRPAGQHGWSLVRSEQPLLNMRLVLHGALDAFAFRRPAVAPDWLAGLTVQVKPCDDPIVDELEHLHGCPWHPNTQWAVDAANQAKPSGHQVQWACCAAMWKAVFDVHWEFAAMRP